MKPPLVVIHSHVPRDVHNVDLPFLLIEDYASLSANEKENTVVVDGKIIVYGPVSEKMQLLIKIYPQWIHYTVSAFYTYPQLKNRPPQERDGYDKKTIEALSVRNGYKGYGKFDKNRDPAAAKAVAALLAEGAELKERIKRSSDTAKVYNRRNRLLSDPRIKAFLLRNTKASITKDLPVQELLIVLTEWIRRSDPEFFISAPQLLSLIREFEYDLLEEGRQFVTFRTSKSYAYGEIKSTEIVNVDLSTEVENQVEQAVHGGAVHNRVHKKMAAAFVATSAIKLREERLAREAKQKQEEEDEQRARRTNTERPIW